MKLFKSHFWYTKSQRNGVFLLILMIMLLQGFIFADFFTSDKKLNTTTPELIALQKQIDSLQLVELENRKPKIYPFNPNYITDFKGKQLGMSLIEIDRLHAFRDSNKFVNSKEEFQKVTKISDALLRKIAPYFKFPDWVVKRNQKNKKISLQKSKKRYSSDFNISKEFIFSSTDINKITAQDLRTIPGIDAAFSERIIKYRSKLQGFSFPSQLYEVWGLDTEIADQILEVFKIIELPLIKKQNINTIEFKQLLKNPYIDYELCKKIFNYRDEVAELQNISELKNIKGFPVDKYDRIVLYLLAE